MEGWKRREKETQQDDFTFLCLHSHIPLKCHILLAIENADGMSIYPEFFCYKEGSLN